MPEESPPYTLPPLAPGEALEVIRRVARALRPAPPICACAVCSEELHGPANEEYWRCWRCRAAGCRPFEGLAYCRPVPESAGVVADDLGDIRQVGGCG